MVLPFKHCGLWVLLFIPHSLPPMLDLVLCKRIGNQRQHLWHLKIQKCLKLHYCHRFVTKTEEFLIPIIPLRYRYIHATAFSSSSVERDYYKILGVPENASQDEIKKVFHSVSD